MMVVSSSSSRTWVASAFETSSRMLRLRVWRDCSGCTINDSPDLVLHHHDGRPVSTQATVLVVPGGHHAWLSESWTETIPRLTLSRLTPNDARFGLQDCA